MNNIYRSARYRALMLFLSRAICGVTLICGATLAPIMSRAQETTPAANPPGARRLTLAEAVALAMKNNRAVLLAQTGVSLAGAAHREAQSAFRPSIFLGSGLAATKGFPLSIEGSAPSIFQVQTQMALVNNSLRSQEREAAGMEHAAEKSLDDKRYAVIAQTVLAYLDLERSRRSLEYLKGHAQILKDTAALMADRVSEGLEPPLEETKARLNAARAQSDSLAIEKQIAMLEFSLRDLTGIPQSETLALASAEIPPLPADETLDHLITRALDNNAAIKAIEEEVRAKELRVKGEQSTLWPRINLVGQYGLFSDINNYSKYFNHFTRNNLTFGISIAVPLFDRYRSSAVLSKAEAELASARLRASEARSGISRQIRQAWGDVEQQAAAEEVAKLELEVARKSLEATLAQYEEGRVNRLAVEQARSQENQAWIGFFQAGYQAEKARLDLLQLGGEIQTAFLH